MKRNLLMIAGLALFLCGCEKDAHFAEYNESSLKHPVLVGEINGQRLYYVTIHLESESRFHSHYVYYLDNNPVLTINRDEHQGKVTVHRVDILLNGKTIATTNLVEDPK